MSEMVNKVARAIADAAGSDFDRLPATHGPGHGLRNMYMNMARAAIEAMRLPTNAMYAAANDEFVPPADAAACWLAMIDAALEN
jgi:hypothetical protein